MKALNNTKQNLSITSQKSGSMVLRLGLLSLRKPYKGILHHRWSGMKIFRSIKNTKAFSLFLAVLLSSALTHGVCNFGYGPEKVVVIQNGSYSADGNAENNCRMKPNFPGIVFKHYGIFHNTRPSDYTRLSVQYPSPKDVFLSRKSTRAPPARIVS